MGNFFPNRLVAVIGLVAFSCYVTKALDCNQGYQDGCSVPDGLPRPFIELFTPQCDKHDLCYDCASHPDYGLTRAQCDWRFALNLKKACKTLPWYKRVPCYASKVVYALGATILGAEEGRFKPPGQEREFCTEPFVEKCMAEN